LIERGPLQIEYTAAYQKTASQVENLYGPISSDEVCKEEPGKYFETLYADCKVLELKLTSFTSLK